MSKHYAVTQGRILAGPFGSKKEANVYASGPTFTAAVKARDWRRAAENSRIRDGNADRNAEHRRLFLAAAGVA